VISVLFGDHPVYKRSQMIGDSSLHSPFSKQINPVTYGNHQRK